MTRAFLGLDQSLSNTGWAVAQISGDAVCIEAYGTLRTKSTSELYARLGAIKAFTKSLIDSYQPEMVFTERVFINPAINTSCINLIRVETVLHQLLVELGFPYIVMPSIARQSDSWRYPFALSSEKKDSANLFGKKLPALTEHSADAVGIVLGGLLQHDYISLEAALNFELGPSLKAS